MKGKSTIPLKYGMNRLVWSARNFSSLYVTSFLVLLWLVHAQCKKSSPPPNILPPVTQEGMNTFGCKVNGEVWIPYSTCNIFIGEHCKELWLEVNQSDTVHKLPISFYLSAGNTLSSSSFMMYAPAPNISLTGNIIDSIVLFYYKGPDRFYHFPPSYTSGALNLTKLDTVTKIMSGTFSFTLYNGGGDSVVVTDGRFDITYNACLCH